MNATAAIFIVWTAVRHKRAAIARAGRVRVISAADAARINMQPDKRHGVDDRRTGPIKK